MLFFGLFLIVIAVVAGIILTSLLRLTENERPHFLSRTSVLILLSGCSLLLFFIGLIILIGPTFS